MPCLPGRHQCFMAQRPVHFDQVACGCADTAVCRREHQVCCLARGLRAHQSTKSTATAGLCCLCLANQLACSHTYTLPLMARRKQGLQCPSSSGGGGPPWTAVDMSTCLQDAQRSCSSGYALFLFA